MKTLEHHLCEDVLMTIDLILRFNSINWSTFLTDWYCWYRTWTFHDEFLFTSKFWSEMSRTWGTSCYLRIFTGFITWVRIFVCFDGSTGLWRAEMNSSINSLYQGSIFWGFGLRIGSWPGCWRKWFWDISSQSPSSWIWLSAFVKVLIEWHLRLNELYDGCHVTIGSVCSCGLACCKIDPLPWFLRMAELALLEGNFVGKAVDLWFLEISWSLGLCDWPRMIGMTWW
jgi:hypothetical protein